MNDHDSLDLNKSKEQKAYRALFVRLGTYALTSTPCPACCPRLVGTGKKVRGWIRGTIGAGTCAVECNNCGFVRVSKERAKSGLEAPSKAQQKALDRIKGFFQSRCAKGEALAQWEVTPDNRGGWWVVVRTPGNCYVSSGAHIHVAGHGSTRVYSVYDLCSNPAQQESTRAHYEKMIRP